MPKSITIAEARKILTPLGILLQKHNYEYRVYHRGSKRDEGYYTDDLQDAVDTGRQMAEARDVRLAASRVPFPFVDRKGNPGDSQLAVVPVQSMAPVQSPPPPSGTTSFLKVAAGVAVVGLVGAGLWKFFTKPMGTIVIDHSKDPKLPKPVVEPPAPEKPLVVSKILAKLPAFDPAATGTVPYYVVNVFADPGAQPTGGGYQELTRPEPGAVDIATYLRSVPVADIQVYGPYMPGQKPDRFSGPLPDLAVIVAPNGMVITSMNKAELAAITPDV
jgi:hypothetical protein